VQCVSNFADTDRQFSTLSGALTAAMIPRSNQRSAMEGVTSSHLLRWEMRAVGNAGLSNHSARLAQAGCSKIFLDLPVHTTCTRRLLTD
jgi:hypothetical protein